MAELKQRLAALVAEPRFEAGLWGVKVISLDTGATLFEHNAHRLFSPASNSKLYTVALGLDRLGADYRIRTSLLAERRPDAAGTLAGDLILYGRGDPTINTRLAKGSIDDALEPLAAALVKAGVRRVTGDLVADVSFIQGPEFGSGWTWDDLEYYYGAEISALTINDNYLRAVVTPGETEGVPARITLSPPTSLIWISNRTETVSKDARGGPRFQRPIDGNTLYVTGPVPLEHAAYSEDITFKHPELFFADWFRQALARRGVRVDGAVRRLSWLEQQGRKGPEPERVELAFIESPPLRDIAREIQKPSQNLYTDLLLATVGERFRGPGGLEPVTSEDLGLRELSKFLRQVGVPRGEVFFEEGSGLSRNNLTTPNATCLLLAHMSRHPAAEAYLEALPIAGVDGTLRNRMKETLAQGNLRGKTGTLRWASSLSGYVTSAAGEKLAFSSMINRYAPGPNRSARADLDEIGALLAGLREKSAP